MIGMSQSYDEDKYKQLQEKNVYKNVTKKTETYARGTEAGAAMVDHSIIEKYCPVEYQVKQRNGEWQTREERLEETIAKLQKK